MKPQLAIDGQKSKLSLAVDEQRLWDRIQTMATFGAREDGGVNRQALSNEDIESRKQLIAWTSALGFRSRVDRAGNLFIRREGLDPSLPPILVGSHLDSQPAGGKFDGAFGVLAGLEALTALETVGVSTRRAVELVSWTNEEGSRFAPGIAGSSAFAGLIELSDLLASKDSNGVYFQEALQSVMASHADLEVLPLGFPVGAYLEAHIEQGPVLESQGCQIGIVTGIQGTRWFTVSVVGNNAHAGTTPLSMRRDAVLAMVSMISALRELMRDETDTVRFTVGRVVLQPNSPNSVAGSAQFSIDLRHPDGALLTELGDQILSVCREHSCGCDVTVEETLTMSPVQFSESIVRTLTSSADYLGTSNLALASGAFHDASPLSDICPTGMIFVPCTDGISHNPAENAEPSDLAAGARVLAIALEACAQSETI